MVAEKKMNGVSKKNLQWINWSIAEDESMINTKVTYFPCPSASDHEIDNQRRKRLSKLDNELAQHVKAWVLCAAYVILLAVICSHNITTEAFRQNEALKLAVNDKFQVSLYDHE